MYMIQINIAEAKAQLSACLDRVQAGETIVICKRNVPIAELRPVSGSAVRPRSFGQDVGRVIVHGGFFDPLPEGEIGLWSGESGGSV